MERANCLLQGLEKRLIQAIAYRDVSSSDKGSPGNERTNINQNNWVFMIVSANLTMLQAGK